MPAPFDQVVELLQFLAETGFAALVVIGVVALAVAGILTRCIYLFLLATLLAAGWFLYLILATDSSYNWLPLLLGFVVYLAYVWFGGSRPVRASSGKKNDSSPQPDPEQFYSNLILPRRGVWTVFGLAIFVTLLLGTSSIPQAYRNSEALQDINDVPWHASKTRQMAQDLVEVASQPPQNHVEWAGFVRQVQAQASLTESQAQIVSARAEMIDSKKLPSEGSMELLKEVKDEAADVIAATQAIQQTPPIDAGDPTTAITLKEFQSQANRIRYFAIRLETIAQSMVPVGRSPIPLLLLVLLFGTLLYFPWVLFFAFILSKRAVIARDTRATLEDLGLIDRLLESTEGIGDEEQKAARQLVRDLDRMTEKAQSNRFRATWEKIDADMKSRFPASEKLSKYLKRQETEDLPDLTRLALHEAQETIIKQRLFYTREYILPLVILTILSAVGWYFIFFPQARVGLVNLITDGTAKAFSEYLTYGISTLTAAFMGGWLYVMVLLITRWTQDDLLPRSYFYAAARLLVALVVGLLFACLASTSKADQAPFWQATILLLAFAVGAAPYDYINAVFTRLGKGLGHRFFGDSDETSLFNAISQEFVPPVWRSRQALTTLEDVTIWAEARLQEEGIENVHGLATCDLERLVIATPFPSQNLVDWVDQALLRIHATDVWHTGFAASGIRTATDLVDRCWPNYPKPFRTGQGTMIQNVVDAWNFGSAATRPSVNGGKPKSNMGQAAGGGSGNQTQETSDTVTTVQGMAPKLTPQIVENMLVAMNSDINLVYVHNYLKNRRKNRRRRIRRAQLQVRESPGLRQYAGGTAVANDYPIVLVYGLLGFGPK